MTVTAKVPQTPLGPLLQSFFVEHLCSHKRVSPRTVESYRDTFRLLLQHLQAKTGKKPSALSIGDLDAPVILSFLENLVDIAVIALWLGHENIQTTHGYIEVDLSIKEQAL